MVSAKGRGSAGHAAMVAIMVAVGLLAVAPAAYAVTHVVGGTRQWDFAPQNDLNYYDATWAANQTFAVGDALEFKYSASGHDVVQYATKAEYDACSGTNVNKWTSGDDIITLNSTGTTYYICSFPGHCAQGMKVAVTVGAAATPPSVAPTTPPVVSPTPPGTTPTPPTPPSTPTNAASSGPFLSMAGLLAAALIAGLALLV